MWTITTSGFVSLVEHDEDPDFIRARARRIEHLQDTFDLQDGDIIDLGPDCPDYRFHANIPRLNVAQKLHDAVMDLHVQSHVKEAVAGNDEAMYSAMMGCWRELRVLQDPPAVAPLDDLDDIVGQVGKLAAKMRAVTDRPPLEQDPVWKDDVDDEDRELEAREWTSVNPDIDSACMICGGDIAYGERYVTLPEDKTYGEPEGPAHTECATDDGWTVL